MKHLAVFSALVLIAAMLCGFVPTEDDMQIYDDVVRLHVLANSDNEEDQNTKLFVRDIVLGYIGDIAANAEGAADAAEKIAASVEDVRFLVEDALARRGVDAAVSVVFGEEYYPARTYDDVSLPSGTYMSLKISLGEARGHNWWCVLYPTICTSSAKASSVMRQTGFSAEQIKILTDGEKPTYKIKFKLVELLSGASS